MADVPDPAFAQGMLGPGFAVVPTGTTVCSPVTGMLRGLFDTKHAFIVQADSGVQVLVHAGLDTVKLNGEHFDALASVDTPVEAGQPIVEWDIDAVRTAGYATHVAVCLVENQDAAVDVSTGRTVAAGDVVARVDLGAQ